MGSETIIIIPALSEVYNSTTVIHDSGAGVHIRVEGPLNWRMPGGGGGHGQSLTTVQADRLAAGLLKVGPQDDVTNLGYKHTPSASQGGRSVEVCHVSRIDKHVIIATRKTEPSSWDGLSNQSVVYATLTPEEAERYAAAILVRAAAVRENMAREADKPKTQKVTVEVEIDPDKTNVQELQDRLTGSGVIGVHTKQYG